ncbi:HEAT repeat domain-containing protein [Thalassotalea marina]|uniref:HEAT repeat domain-containing protein n=1 Tax=Thalassotalea marina TaxID=1673741 RepID=A0A919BF04_9GAMM|nr:HEAT repeat domain-containing protein [Thalassotalea marina]GHF84284.1 hypothetical protein GCM10017161_09600 [Thalassotalea marina]
MKNEVTVQDISEFQLELHQTYKKHPILAAILKQLENVEDFDFWQYQQQFAKLLSSDFVEQAVNKELGAFLEEDFYQLPLYFNNGRAKGWVILNTPYFRFNTYFFDGALVNDYRTNNKNKTFSIQTSPQDLLMYFPKAKGAILDLYECVEQNAESDIAPQVRLKESIQLQDGQFVEIKAGLHATHFREITKNLTYYEVSSVSSAARMVGEYDLNSLSLLGLSAANLSSSRAEMFSEMVASLQHKESAPVLKKLCQHRDHFVRWSAATSLYSLDNDAGEEMIQSLTQDPHPDVRQTAQKCVAMFAAQ